MKAIIRRWTSALFTEEVKTKLALTERQVFQAATLQELDDVYTRKLAGFESVSGTSTWPRWFQCGGIRAAPEVVSGSGANFSCWFI